MRRKRLRQGLDTVEAKAPQSPSAPPAATPLFKKPAAMKKKAWGLHEKCLSNLTTLFGAHGIPECCPLRPARKRTKMMLPRIRSRRRRSCRSSRRRRLKGQSETGSGNLPLVAVCPENIKTAQQLFGVKGLTAEQVEQAFSRAAHHKATARVEKISKDRRRMRQ